jgi:hypothetical protein
VITDNPALADGLDPTPLVIPRNGPLTALTGVLPLQVAKEGLWVGGCGWRGGGGGGGSFCFKRPLNVLVTILRDCSAPLTFLPPFHFFLFLAQLIAYELAILKGINPDVPRNLAKAVTVD